MLFTVSGTGTLCVQGARENRAHGGRGGGGVPLHGVTLGHAADLGFYLKCGGKHCIKGGMFHKLPLFSPIRG